MAKKIIKITGWVVVEGTVEEIADAKKFFKKEIAKDLEDQFINLPENVNVHVTKQKVLVK